MNREELFSIHLFSIDLSLDNKSITSYCKSLKENNIGRNISNIGGYQSDDIEVVPEELEDLYTQINIFSSECVKILEIKPVHMHNMWVNINQQRDFNWPHNHPDSVLAGVYYVKTPNDCGDISFDHPAEDIMVSTNTESIKENSYNRLIKYMPSIKGRLYLFPAWLKHRVDPNMSQEERISISFNLVH